MAKRRQRLPRCFDACEIGAMGSREADFGAGFAREEKAIVDRRGEDGAITMMTRPCV